MERLGTVAIVGVGLIGGSIGLALRARGLAGRIVGVGRDPARLAEARRLGAIDDGTTDLARGVAEAEVAVICTPVTLVAAVVRLAAEHGRDDLLVTDAGSTKRAIVAAVEANEAATARFVGAHPIAGSERSGATHARADLFDGRACVLTPTERTPRDRLRRAHEFWRGLGCVVTEMTPAAHDEALARTSHLPHVVAAALAASVPASHLALAAGAYRDGTRVAGADAGLWVGIFSQNRGPLLEALDTFADRLTAFRSALVADDEAALRGWWSAARACREAYDEPPIPHGRQEAR